MVAAGETPRLTSARRAERQARDQRLADALRENLRRRKEQTRTRETAAGSAPEPVKDPDTRSRLPQGEDRC